MERVNKHLTSRESQYWTDFYEKNDFSKGSSFFEFLNKIPEMPGTIIDIGCGQGRDSFAFASSDSDRRVIGLDRSPAGVESANSQAQSANIEDRLTFFECDVSDNKDLIEKLEYARSVSTNGDVCYYMRFFLHSIPEDVQDSLMRTIAEHSQEGDVLAVEFRTDKDLQTQKEFGDTHYRRYQNAEEFSNNLRSKYGWSDVLFETEDKGLSPYKYEDPVLYRAIAVK